MSLNGFVGSVSLTANPSSGLSATLGKSVLVLTSGGTDSTTLSFSAATAGSYTATVTGVSGAVTHMTATITVVFTQPDFSLSCTPPSVSFVAGTSGTSSCTITPTGGFTGNVTLSATPSSPDISASMSPSTINTSGSSTLTVSGSVAGSYSANVTAASGSISHSFLVTVTVTPPTGAKEPIITQFNFKHHLSLSKNGFAQTFRVGIFNNNTSTTLYAYVEIDGVDGTGTNPFTITSSVVTIAPGLTVNNIQLVKAFTSADVGETWTVTVLVHWGTSPTSQPFVSNTRNHDASTTGSFTIYA